MSSEQVIAELREAQRGYEASGETEMADQFRDWADRLSTPANMVTVPASELRAMREEIAELLAARERAYDNRDMALQAAEHDAAKLSALLDGIEGLEKAWRSLDTTFATYTCCADDLKALREKANG